MVEDNSVHAAGKRFVNKKDFRKSREELYSLEQLADFYTAIYGAYKHIFYQNADAVIAPLRGAEPFTKSLSLLASLDGKSSQLPRLYYPRVGQVNYFDYKGVVEKIPQDLARTDNQIDKEQKQEMRGIIERVIKRVNPNGDPRKRVLITLIDEVFSGGALSKNVSLVEKAIQDIATERGKRGRTALKIDLTVVSIAQKGVKHCKEYQHLKSRRLVKEFYVSKLFTTDSMHFLFPLVKPKPGTGWRNRIAAVWKSNRPNLGITRKAMRGRDTLLSDISAMHELHKRFGVTSQKSFDRFSATMRQGTLFANGVVAPSAPNGETRTARIVGSRSYIGFAKDFAKLSRLRR